MHGTILIAKGLSAYIIAEGIETEEEAQLMRLAGCQQLQGWRLDLILRYFLAEFGGWVTSRRAPAFAWVLPSPF